MLNESLKVLIYTMTMATDLKSISLIPQVIFVIHSEEQIEPELTSFTERKKHKYRKYK